MKPASAAQRFRPGAPSHVESRQYGLEIPSRVDGGACREYCRAGGAYRAKRPGSLGGFTHPRKGASGWWEWKPHKRHLEGLFTAGEVMVVERRNFHRVYDLTRRVMPDWDDERDALSREDAEAIMLRNSARSLGIFRAQWLADYYRLRQPALPGLLAAWQEEGLVVPVNVEALGEMWLHHEALAQLETAPGGKLTASHSAVLSPFDPVVWDRKRAEQLFNFSYRLECYTPAPKRQYGYFVLPLLHQGNWSGGWTVKYIAKAGSWRYSPCGWRRG